jgi:hypothetical protein
MGSVDKTISQVIDDAIDDPNFRRWLGYELYPILCRNIIRFKNGFSPQIKIPDPDVDDTVYTRDFIIRVQYDLSGKPGYRDKRPPHSGKHSDTCSLLVVPKWTTFINVARTVGSRSDEIYLSGHRSFLDREIGNILNDDMPAFKTVHETMYGFILISVNKLLEICSRCRSRLNIAMIMWFKDENLSSISQREETEDENLWSALPINVMREIVYYV